MDTKITELSHYLNQVLKDRNLSIRAFATYAGLAHATVRRILAGEKVDAETLRRLAGYLSLPIENVYRMAGILPPEEGQRQSLAIESDEYLALDPRVRRLDILLSRDDENFRTEFFEVIYAIYHILKGVRRKGL